MAFTACGPQGTSNSAKSECRTLNADLNWYGDNREKIDAMLAEYGSCGGSGNVDEGAPVALFDWDNTVVKNDIGDAMTFWMLANGKVKQPENYDWSTISPYLTKPAQDALSKACKSLAEPGFALGTNSEQGTACADEILSIYTEGTTKDGQEAFSGFNARRIEPQYAFAAQLLSGYSEADIESFARTARRFNLENEQGATQKIGTSEVTAWVRYYDQTTDLIDTLRANGFDVRVISASSQPVAWVWAKEIGFSQDKVMGVLTGRDDKGVITSELSSCGGEASMPYIEGKRCRVNEEVFKIPSEKAFEIADESHRAVFAAGDSDTDVSFMSDAKGLRLVINRNKAEVMCRAYHNEDGKWIINPMFIDPKPALDKSYDCDAAGRVEEDGSTGPLEDAQGQLITDQEDKVFAEK